ncbi:hypothetical protein SERLADRAFT_404855 [Serpula lacrymans var. lacrymans S7.9]|uniref:DUF6532 domain-containing protein n=1 Tax=Serpula lacrymans var. lacrymans (strain S7.9) TaxID=578457 RepID=F8NFN4_SERL9|nr:uncharacterized protein SERLADRAFT_404855 [Serpula lacrymans var. lacrymans S7.9]EGO30874.1 hypothetical protein SERLADRAFT_404855 [Serpula lacrymans var. lacrymans S7.9]
MTTWTSLWLLLWRAFVAKSKSPWSQEGISLANLWRDFPQPKPSKKQFEQWHAMGCKFAAIAAGGSIYALVLVAGLNLQVQLGEMDGMTPWGIANVFRLSGSNCWGVRMRTIDIAHVPIHHHGQAILGPLSSSLPLVVLPEMYVVSTTFQNMAEGNRQYSAPRDPGTNYEWTKSESERASRAIKVTDVEDLTAKIQKHYDGGVHTDPSAYLYIPSSIVPSIPLLLKNSNDSLMLFLNSSMPESIRTTLLPNFQSCLGSTTSLHHVDSAVEGKGFTFEALHFSWYNRHCTKLVPYTSKEIQDHTDIYQRHKNVFADLFEWINEMLATYLPAKYLVLKQHAELLFGNNTSAVCPFLGLVVNINVSTKAHRDAKDKLFCLVIPLDIYQLFDPEFVTNCTSHKIWAEQNSGDQLMKKLQTSEKDANADRLADICQKTAHIMDTKDGEEEGDLDRPDIDSEDEPLHKRARNSMEEELEDEDEDALMQTFRCLTGNSQQVTPSPSLTQELDNPCYEQMVSSLRTNIQITASPAESVWLVNNNRKRNSSSSPSLTPSRDSKAIITSFSPTSSRLAKAGHSQMCVILSTVKGFPGTDERDELVWNAIIKVASSSSLFKTTIVDLENARNEQKKSRIIDYVWAAAAQLRGEVKQKARILILSEYALKNKLPEEVRTIVEWLLSNGKDLFI